MKRVTLETVKTWSWYKKMPSLMQEFFNEKIESGNDVRFAKMMAEEKYYDVVSEVGMC